ncbi:hypothetical protein BST37_21595 [Mycobacterium noviomagense]|uniref:Uncharacterized protein n=1 Tax=Mycobacterium noviomagense TaxID=459858 RepID=A0ABX3SZC3_9MYCO|nr:hypothetical protein BST37_21595 [Mycobacterium noviomagense]
MTGREPVNLNEAPLRGIYCILLWLVGAVDPRDFGDLRRFGRLADEPFGMCGISGVEYAGALVADCFGQAVVDIRGGMQPQRGMAMFIVVPAEEDLGH